MSGLLNHLVQRVVEPPALQPLAADPFAGPSLREANGDALAESAGSTVAPEWPRAAARAPAPESPPDGRVEPLSPASRRSAEQPEDKPAWFAPPIADNRSAALAEPAATSPFSGIAADAHERQPRPVFETGLPLSAPAPQAALHAPRHEARAEQQPLEPPPLRTQRFEVQHALEATPGEARALAALAARLDALQRELGARAPAARLSPVRELGEPGADRALSAFPVVLETATAHRAPQEASAAPSATPAASAKPLAERPVTTAPVVRREVGEASMRLRALPLPAASESRLVADASSEAGAGSAAPEVHISIGRVEIRAALSAAVVRPRAAAAERPGLSLSRYLEQRGGRR